MKKTLRPYQKRAKTNILKQLPIKPCVLAFCTGGGKTHTAHEIIKEFRKKSPKSRVLVLAHNQVVLRKNFMKGGFFEASKESSVKEIKSKDVVVAIPSTIKDKDIGKFGLLVVDEAHEFFGKKMVEGIRKKIGKHQLLLLTASHGEFKSEKYHKELYSVMEGYDDGHLAKDTKIEILSTAWNFTDEDYKGTEDLRKDYKFSNKEVVSACNAILNKMKETEKSKGKVFNFFNRKLEIKGKLTKTNNISKLPKTLIACHNVKMADMMFDFFNKHYPEQILVSYSASTKGVDADDTGERMLEFKNDPSKRMLIVVRRGILGYDVPETEYVIDLTASKNVDRTTQLLGRVLRKHGGSRKHYFKVVPDFLENYTWYQMGAVVALFHPVNNEKWTGQASQVPILTKEKKKKKRTRIKTPGVDLPPTTPPTTPIPKAIINFEEYRHVFTKADADECIWMRRERFTTLASVKGHGNGKDPDRKKREILTLCEKLGRRITNSDDRKLRDSMAHFLVTDNKFKEELDLKFPFVHASVIANKKKKEILRMCRDLGRRITSSDDNKLYNRMLFYSNKNSEEYDPGFEEMLAEFPPKATKWTLKQIYEHAKRYNSRGDWKNNHEASYAWALKNCDMDRVCAHMVRKNRSLKDNEIKTIAKRYRTRNAWCEGDGGSYSTALARGKSFFESCCSHMPKNANTKKIKCNETGIEFDSCSEAIRVMGIRSIPSMLRGACKSAGGYTFSYVEEDE